MKFKVQIFENEAPVFKGKILTVPMKNEEVIKKSIELFDDEDPCIIHQSYVFKEFASSLLDLLQDNNNEIIAGNFKEELKFLDYTNLDTIKIVLL